MHLSIDRTRRARIALLSLLGVAALGAWTAPFHLHLLRSSPAANATIPAAPQAIRLWFSQTPELKVTTVKVTGPSNATVPLAPLASGDSDLVVAPVKGSLTAGAYSVTWRTMARDGHVARGTFAFTVSPQR